MSSQYSRDHCKVAVAKVLQTLGWHSITSTPLEVLTDILVKYIQQITKTTNEYCTEFGQTEPNLDHLGLTFQEMGISMTELEEYTMFVNFIPGAPPAPKFPIPKENNLNFLKPGSKEVVTRPVHINEHLPPMYPLLEETEDPEEKFQIKEELTIDETVIIDPKFKKPDPPMEYRRIKREEETGSRPTREISSVMMTTSGFLSPAREGKLPEAKAPAPPPPPPPPVIEPLVVPPLEPPIPVPPPVKKKVEKKKEKVPKEPERKVQTAKKKQAPPVLPVSSGVTLTPIPMEVSKPVERERGVIVNAQKVHKEKMDKALAAAKAKTLKLNTTITPIPPLPPEKLLNEPDKKKVDIFKKISNKPKKDSRANTPSLMVDESLANKITHLSSDITIEPIHPHQDKGDFYLENHPSPPITAPKTPDIILNSPPIPEKRKRKEPSRKRQKKPAEYLEPNYMDFMERPKTPDVLLNRMRPFPPMPYPFPLLAGFGGPGLIPSQMFPFPQFGNLPNFSGKNPYTPFQQHNQPVNAPSQQAEQPVPLSSPKPKEPSSVEIKPIEPVVPPQPIQVPDSVHSSTNPVPVAEAPVPKAKEHKKEKKEKIKKKKEKKDKDKKEKLEKKKLKELKKDGKEKPKKKKKDKNPTPTPTTIPNPGSPMLQKIILKVNSPSPRPETPDKKLNILVKPVKEPEPVEPPQQRSPSPQPSGLAKISALVTGPPKPKIQPDEPVPVPVVATSPKAQGRPRVKSKPKTPKKVEQPFKKIDDQGNEVWICPACGQQDDGRPMIGCDGCDAWYHWVCVGIQVPPDENENWYCKPCLCRKNEDLQSDKKRKRKRKEKKEH